MININACWGLSALSTTKSIKDHLTTLRKLIGVSKVTYFEGTFSYFLWDTSQSYSSPRKHLTPNNKNQPTPHHCPKSNFDYSSYTQSKTWICLLPLEKRINSLDPATFASHDSMQGDLCGVGFVAHARVRVCTAPTTCEFLLPLRKRVAACFANTENPLLASPPCSLWWCRNWKACLGSERLLRG